MGGGGGGGEGGEGVGGAIRTCSPRFLSFFLFSHYLK